ncbi:MAG TPA: hypothetical protein VF746_02730 [Longimicrobium sp.]|jgi:hypothetical protein
MSRKRIVPTALALFALSACGGGAGPTASDAGLQARFSSGGAGTSGGGRTGGGTATTQEESGGTTTTTTVQTDTTQNGTRGGFIGSGG